MPNIDNRSDDCGKPGCDRDAEKTYEGENGNTVRVCGMHYYRLVTRGESEYSPVGMGFDITTGEISRRQIGGGTTLGDTEPEPDIRFG